MILSAANSVMTFSNSGSLISYRQGNHEMIAAGGEKRPLFTLRMRDENGQAVDVDALSFRKIDCTGNSIRFSGNDRLDLTVTYRFSTDDKTGRIGFSAGIDNRSDLYVEYLDIADITVPDDFAPAGGSGKIFWPGMEGSVTDNPAERDAQPFKGFAYYPVDYPTKGWEGFYPGPVQMQFMAYYNNDCGFYFAAHDTDHIPKAIEYHMTADGARLEMRLFVCIDRHTSYQMPFEVVFQAGIRDWMDAAELYRSYITEKDASLPPKLSKRSLPDWVKKHPLIITYPVRGTKDTGDMTQNKLFPYENVLPIAEEYSRLLDTQVMILLMHWEGTAPWAPPYIWPPFGGEDLFRRFVEKVHAEGNLVGLYASGIGWTDESVLWPSYEKKSFRLEKGLTDLMCAAPDQSLPHSAICNGPIRWGYDLCPTHSFVTDCVTGEIGKAADAGVDYLQYFDQNIGGAPCRCYSKKHGHLPMPGKWSVDAMSRLYDEIHTMLDQKGSDLVIGCEAAAAECSIRSLAFSDLRYSIDLIFTSPVPAYAYVFHEYIHNFMGNQNAVCGAVPPEPNPYSLHFRTAYSFIAGDALTAVINDEGELIWGWGMPWDIPQPDRESMLKLMRGMIAVEKSAASWLSFGRMVRPLAYSGGSFTLTRTDGSTMTYPDVLSSAWENEDGEKMQLFVNYTPGDKEIVFDAPVQSRDRREPVRTLTVPEFTSVMIQF